MKYGIKFCGGCNPRYERGSAFKSIIADLPDKVNFEIAREEVDYDGLLVVAGCSNCCPELKGYKVKRKPIKMWDEKHIDQVKVEILKEVDVT